MIGKSLLKRNINYRHLWLAQIGSSLGDWFNQVALAQITLELTHSSVSMGLVLLSRSLPSVVLGPFVAPFVDRFRKKPFLFVTDAVRAILVLGYIFVTLSHQQWLLYVDSLALGIAGVLFAPARQAALPFVVNREDLATANSLQSISSAIVQIVGAALGGITASALNPILCFVINSISYVWSSLHILRSHWHESETLNQKRQSYFSALKDGYRETLVNRPVRAIILIGIAWGLAGGGYYILLRLLGSEVFHLGGLGIGLLYVIDGLGVLFGGYFVKRFVGNAPVRASVWYGVSYITQAIFFSLMTISSNVAFGATMLLLMRTSSGVIIPLDTYLLQVTSPQSMRGRIFALHGSTYGGVMQLSYLMTGIGFQYFGIARTGLIIGIASLLCGLSWIFQFGNREISHSLKMNNP